MSARLRSQAEAKLAAVWDSSDRSAFRGRRFGAWRLDDAAAEVSRRNLDRYGVLDRPDWRLRDDVRSLGEADHVDLEMWMVEQAWRLASAWSRRPDSPGRLAEGARPSGTNAGMGLDRRVCRLARDPAIASRRTRADPSNDPSTRLAGEVRPGAGRGGDRPRVGRHDLRRPPDHMARGALGPLPRRGRCLAVRQARRRGQPPRALSEKEAGQPGPLDSKRQLPPRRRPPRPGVELVEPRPGVGPDHRDAYVTRALIRIHWVRPRRPRTTSTASSRSRVPSRPRSKRAKTRSPSDRKRLAARDRRPGPSPTRPKPSRSSPCTSSATDGLTRRSSPTRRRSATTPRISARAPAARTCCVRTSSTRGSTRWPR